MNMNKIIQIIEDSINRTLSDDIQQYKKDIGELLFVKEFGHIIIKLPRRSGHTTAALYLLNKYDSILLLPDNRFISILNIDKNTKINRVFTIKQFNNKGRPKKFMTIIDNTSICKMLLTDYNNIIDDIMLKTEFLIELG